MRRIAVIVPVVVALLLPATAASHGTLVRASTVSANCAMLWGAGSCGGAVGHQSCQLLAANTWYCREWGMAHPGPSDWYHGGVGWRIWHH